MSKAKKVIFVIVEGPTDEDALSSVLKQIFSSAAIGTKLGFLRLREFCYLI